MNKPLVSNFVAQFRKSAPYINAFRGKTFVIYINGRALLSDLFISLSQDISLLDSLGIRLVLVHGCRRQIDNLLMGSTKIIDGIRVTDDAALNAVKQAVGKVRIEFEAVLSRGLANSPMEGADITISSGNYVKAKPYGIRNGINFLHTGEVRNINTIAVRAELEQGHIVLLSPLGYSATGEVFNVCAEDIAFSVAEKLHADKLLFLFDSNLVNDPDNTVVRQLAVEQIEQDFLQQDGIDPYTQKMLSAAVESCRRGVSRLHFLNANVNGCLLQELFSRDGVGCLISLNPFEGTRAATINDLPGILELIEPLEAEGILVRRDRETLEMDLDHFTVTVRDGMILACAALYQYKQHDSAELACLAVHPDYQHEGRGDVLLRYLERQLKINKLGKLFVLSTRASHWFLERNFIKANLDDLPLQRKSLYNYQRNSNVYIKQV
ncbi:MAG: amino-acid N-acetyltransferase [Thiohalomonadales bacterium]